MAIPLVTVICLCYNQERFVKESILSVLNQTYPVIQLIVVDDASTDNSVKVIKESLVEHPQVQILPLRENSGNCKAFNQALSLAKGEFIIDLAADDVLLHERVQKGVMALNEAGESFGINFTDANWINEDGSHGYRHSERFPHHTIPEGNIYQDLIARFFICSSSMMFKRKVIDSLGGYNPDLAYEDFDFWIRSSRNFNYCYSPEVLVKKRMVKNSMSQKQFRIFSPQLKSTFKVCEKIMALNKSAGEQEMLAKRILYEMSVCVRSLSFSVAFDYARLYFKNRARNYER